ncbi:hypothetical protein OIU74_017994, partial [Salix koriyanagi]
MKEDNLSVHRVWGLRIEVLSALLGHISEANTRVLLVQSLARKKGFLRLVSSLEGWRDCLKFGEHI